jgi:hypothetical protein
MHIYNFLSLDYKFLFDCVALGRENLELDPLPKVGLQADAAGAISKGFRLSKINNGIRGTCWFHCKKSFDKGLLSIRDVDKKKNLLADVYQLQLSQSPDIFKNASKLFVEKYLSDDDERVRTFIVDFSKEWIDQNNTWYESYNHPNDAGSCSTNNGNESINRVVKAEDTLRKLLPLSEFLIGNNKIIK